MKRPKNVDMKEWYSTKCFTSRKTVGIKRK